MNWGIFKKLFVLRTTVLMLASFLTVCSSDVQLYKMSVINGLVMSSECHSPHKRTELQARYQLVMQQMHRERAGVKAQLAVLSVEKHPLPFR